MTRARELFDRVRARRTQLGLAIRVTVAAVAAYAIASALHLLLPLWAVLRHTGRTSGNEYAAH